MIDFIFILRLLINPSKRERNEKIKKQKDELDNDPFGKEQKPKQILPARINTTHAQKSQTHAPKFTITHDMAEITDQ